MKFDLPKELASIIKVIGVGGGGSNAVNHMHDQGIKGVDFLICNTDRQALDVSPVPVKLQLGEALTEGLGAGSIPERGKDAAQENIEEIRQLLNDRTKMVFITAGMGGGTGTGAAPVIAQIARDMGILTVGIVTSPFQWEGRKRKQQAASGIEEMRAAVDTLLVINNDRLRDLYGNLSLDNAFAHADNVLTTAARGIAEIITVTGKVNVDFEDVKTVMTGSGVAVMGMAEADGDDRALSAAQAALASPLLNDNDIKGAKYVLLNITHGTREVLMDEINEITDHIQDAAGSSADVIWGYCKDEALGEKVRVTVIATGFDVKSGNGPMGTTTDEKVKIPLDAERPTMITRPISNPLGTIEPKAKEEEPAEKTKAEPYIKTIGPSPEEQRKFDFEPPNVKPAAETPSQASPDTKQPEKVVRHQLMEDAGSTEHRTEAAPRGTLKEPAQGNEARISPVEHQGRVEDRLANMREHSMKLRTPNGLSELEREPAYKRKKIVLNDAPQSTDTNVSRYTLNEETDENGERRVELKRNNPYLHDNVD